MRPSIKILFTALLILLTALFIMDIATGDISISISEIADTLMGRNTDIARKSIIIDIRLVKALMALLAGAALSVSGLQMQTVFRNPLAGPYVLGISSGASIGVALFVLAIPVFNLNLPLELRSVGTAGAAWIGSAAMLLLIISISRKIKDIMVILILGMMISSGVSAFVEILQYLSNEAALKSYIIWTMGSLGDVTTSQLGIIAPIIVAGLILAVYTLKDLNIILLGDNYARTLGLNLKRSRMLIFISTTLLAGTITAFCGPIGFIGLAVPHLTRMLFRSSDHRIVLPGAVIIGSIVLIICDIISKYLTLPINTITALMGIPIVILIVTKNSSLLK